MNPLVLGTLPTTSNLSQLYFCDTKSFCVFCVFRGFIFQGTDSAEEKTKHMTLLSCGHPFTISFSTTEHAEDTEEEIEKFSVYSVYSVGFMA